MPDPAELFDYAQPIKGAPTDPLVMRNQFEALARLFWTENAANPSAPRDGQPRVNAADPANVKLQLYISGAWRTAIEHLEETSVGIKVKRIFAQVTVASVWTVDHNIGSYPAVQAFDATGNQLVVGTDYTLQQVTLNRTVLTFGAPQGGTAVLIG